jgi:hypothetical protein
MLKPVWPVLSDMASIRHEKDLSGFFEVSQYVKNLFDHRPMLRYRTSTKK